MQSWIYLHFPSLQSDGLFSEHTALPLAIVESKRFKVVQHNMTAHEQGIEIGMGLGTASALCHQLQVHPYDEDVEQQALMNIAQWLYMVTSDICLIPPQGILLKVTNMLSLYGGLECYWQRVSEHLDQLDFHYQFSIGFSPFSAMLLAKANTQLLTLDKQVIIDALKPFPLQATELEINKIEKLQRVGVATLRELLDIPIQELARRFDIDLVNYIGRLMGQFKHPIDFFHPPEQFENYQELLFDIENIQWLEKPLSKLLKKLEMFLTLRNQVGYELELVLHQRDKQACSVHFYSASGDYFAKRWIVLCQLTMESLQLEAPVQGLTLRLIRSGELESTSADLFKGFQGEQTEMELIGLLQAKLGKEQVRKTVHSHDPRPEKSTFLCDPTLPIPNKLASNKLRPSFMLPTPELLSEKVSLIQGPERFVTGWWDGDDMTRDYFVARSDQGRWLWVFRNQDKQWFTHGLFS
ncbi:Y-family DNA polymerase [Vibrio ouci]|uniref:DNA polymerase Y family protein n=1 Tax=Vibrio ouci TaxID=2499078 RepID=A0A4Y8WL20_9VIBR|nr:DNA polymerase Y family protein [Vibrio ouci]TFH93660.1 DNA polymerase Y family protein [Vibrio ouci]